MVQRTRILCCAILLSLYFTISICSPISIAFAFATAKPILALNLQQGPLGVTLHLQGKHFHPGSATFSYIDAQGVPGTFTGLSTNTTIVQSDGSFDSPNVILPNSGPAGIWKIVVTDSTGTVVSARYTALAAPGSSEASAPTLIINPTSGGDGDLIAFTGSNWLPSGTAVNLWLLTDGSSLPLLDTPQVSDKNGAITGAFHLPANLPIASATINATDGATGALRAQSPITLITSSPTPTASQTATASPTTASGAGASTTPVATPTPAKNLPLASDSTRWTLTPLEREGWGIALLLVGGMLGVAATMLILFLIPWNERKRNIPHMPNMPRGRHY